MARGFTKDGKFRPTGNKNKKSSRTKSINTKGIPIYNTKVNFDDKRKPFLMWIVKHPEGSQRVKGSETIVMAEHFGQAVDDYETVWNKEHRLNRDIGYPVIQGTVHKNFRY